MLYCTYVGDPTTSGDLSLAVDSPGHAYLFGSTQSASLSMMGGAVQTVPGGMFVARVDWNATSQTSVLGYQTYLGGAETCLPEGIATDGTGCVYVTGYASINTSSGTPTSTLFTSQSPSWESAPIVPGWQQQPRDYGDAGFVIKVDTTATSSNGNPPRPLYATFVGGSLADPPMAICVANGSACIAGLTFSPDLPVTAGAVQSTIAHQSNISTLSGLDADAFVVQLSADGTTEAFATYLGGNYEDIGTSIAYDPYDSTLNVAGATYSPDFPVTANGGLTSFGGSGVEGFMVKLAMTSSGPVTLSGIAVTPSPIAGGNWATGYLILNGPAPYGGAAVQLTTSLPNVAQPALPH